MSVKGFLTKYFKAEGETKNEVIAPQTVSKPIIRRATVEDWVYPKDAVVFPKDAVVPEEPKAPQPEAQAQEQSPPEMVQVGLQTRDIFHIFTDGACSDNGRRGARGGFGVFVYSDRASKLDMSEPLMNSEPQTNNRGELRAIEAALDLIDKHGEKWSKTSEEYWIWSDSEYSINALTKWANGWRRNGWKKRDGKLILNLDLIKPIYERLSRSPRISLHHVRAHQDHRQHEFPYDGNHQADLLARKSTQIQI